MNSHSQQSGHRGAKPIEQVTIDQTQKVVQERGNCEDQRKPLILITTVCKKDKSKDKRIPRELNW